MYSKIQYISGNQIQPLTKDRWPSIPLFHFKGQCSIKRSSDFILILKKQVSSKVIIS